MNNLPIESVSTEFQFDGDRIQTTIDLLNFSGVQAFKSVLSNGEPQADGTVRPPSFGVVIFVPGTALQLFDGAKENESACMAFIRNLMFPFQELQRYVAEGDISGFAILPEKDYVNDVWANQRTELIGKTLQGIAEGAIDPSR